MLVMIDTIASDALVFVEIGESDVDQRIAECMS